MIGPYLVVASILFILTLLQAEMQDYPIVCCYQKNARDLAPNVRPMLLFAQSNCSLPLRNEFSLSFSISKKVEV